jgi:hypothetical protein
MSSSEYVFKIYQDIKGLKCLSELNGSHLCFGSSSSGDLYLLEVSSTDLSLTLLSWIQGIDAGDLGGEN